MDPIIQTLKATLIGEILNAIGLPAAPVTRWFFTRLFHSPTERLSGIGVTFDQLTAREGLPSACRWVLTHWCSEVTSRGTATIPQTGPLLVVSNHAGAYDSIVIASQLERKDVKFIASDVAFLRNFPSVSEHFIYISANEPFSRMVGMRAAIRHVQSGGSLILFGTGLIDPDPAIDPNAGDAIDAWSPSISLFLRQVPELQLVISIVSGILSPRWAHHPLTRLRKIPWQKRRLAEFGQVIEQLFRPGRLYVSPRNSFSAPVDAARLGALREPDSPLLAVIQHGKEQLAEHLAWINSLREV